MTTHPCSIDLCMKLKSLKRTIEHYRRISLRSNFFNYRKIVTCFSFCHLIVACDLIMKSRSTDFLKKAILYWVPSNFHEALFVKSSKLYHVFLSLYGYYCVKLPLPTKLELFIHSPDVIFF